MFIKGVFVLFALANITAGDIPTVEADKKVGHKKSCCSSKFCQHSLQSFDFCQPLPPVNRPLIRVKRKLNPAPTVTKEEPSSLIQGQASKLTSTGKEEQSFLTLTSKPTSTGLMRKKKRKKRPVGTTIGTMVGGLEKDLNISSQAPESKLLTSTLLTDDSLSVLDAASQKGTSSKPDLETVSASADNGKAISISINKTEEFDEQEKKISSYQADGIIDNEQALVFLKTKRLKDVDTDTEEYQEEFFADEEDEEEDEINNENDSKIINIFAKPIKKKKINKTLRRHVI